jgi:hypothetical protein
MRHLLKIYIASSFRNLPAVLLLRDALLERGHTVLDWTSLAPPLPEYLTPEQRRLALDSDERGDVFSFCVEACGNADLVVYLGPAGQDAACEVGIAWAAGVPVFGITSPMDRPGTVLSRAVSVWASSPDELLEKIRGFAA